MGILMRNRKCYTGKVKENKYEYKVVATANASQTYGAQISSLASVYNGLTDDEKIKSFLYASSGNVFHMANTSKGRFSMINSDKSAASIGTINFDSGKYVYIYASSSMTWTRTDATSTTHNYTLSLCVYD